jgi:hypothetical protein
VQARLAAQRVKGKPPSARCAEHHKFALCGAGAGSHSCCSAAWPARGLVEVRPVGRDADRRAKLPAVLMVADQGRTARGRAAFHGATGLADSCSTPSAQNSLQVNRSPSTRHCRIWPSTTANEFSHQAHCLNFERCDMSLLHGLAGPSGAFSPEQHGVGPAATAVLAITKPRIFEERREPAGKAHSCDRQHIGPGALSLMSASPTGDRAQQRMTEPTEEKCHAPR